MKYEFPVLFFLSLFGLLVLGSGCDRNKPVTSESAGAQEAVVQPVAVSKPVPAMPSSISINVERAFGAPSIAVQLSLPATWMEGNHDDVARLLPKTQPDEFFQTILEVREGNTSCQGTCDSKQIRANIAGSYASYKKRLETPNLNTGDPQKDAYRAELHVLEDTASEGNIYKRVFAAKVTCPGKGAVPCVPRLAARCFYYQEGADYHLIATGSGPVVAENTAWPELMALCKGLTFPPAEKKD